jgi:hypothetical protein
MVQSKQFEMIACDVQRTVKSLKHDRKDFHVRFPVSLGVCCQPLRAGVSGAGPLVIPMSIRKGSTIGCTAQSLLSAKIPLDVNLVGQETSFQLRAFDERHELRDGDDLQVTSAAVAGPPI